MNAEVKTKWLEALRSGKYKQGKYRLHNLEDDSYCCLGVLCELAREANVNVIKTPKVILDYTAYDDKMGVLPTSVKNWAEISEYNPKLISGISIGDFNDRGATFEEIANVIEAEF